MTTTTTLPKVGAKGVNPLRALLEFGQSPWMDYIRRDLLTSGGLSLTQSVITLLRRDFEGGTGLASASSRDCLPADSTDSPILTRYLDRACA